MVNFYIIFIFSVLFSIYNKNFMKYKTTKEELEKIVLNSLSIADVCRELNIVPVGGNYKTVKSKILLWNIDISHFTGQGWNVGKKYKQVKRNIPLIEILIENSTYTSNLQIKNRLFIEGYKEKKCDKCGLIKWLGEEISLELHHKNGNNLDHRIENIEILCPNCHSQTDHFRGGNIKSAKNKLKKQEFDDFKDFKFDETVYEKDKTTGIKKKINFCSCGVKINRNSKQCMSCKHINNRKVERPELSVLLDDIKKIGYRGTGEKYGVSDNAIRKWIKNYEKQN